ncbi:MAG: hypothetical protein ACI87E_002651 [Mariniblastus sp.]
MGISIYNLRHSSKRNGVTMYTTQEKSMLSRIRMPFHSLFSQAGKLIMGAALTLGLVLGSTPFAAGQTEPVERPSTQDLLPETTVGFIQVDNFRDMLEKIKESSMGQMSQDEAIAPLLEGLWEEAKLAYDDVKDDVGVSLEDLQALPSGEMTFAVIAPRRKDLAFMLVIELEENEAVDRVLDRGRQLIQEEGGEEITSEESEDGITYESFVVNGQNIKFFRKDGLMVGCSSEDELDALVDRWMGREVKKVRPLSSNRKFVTIMNRCVGTKDLKPEARFFVDPIGWAKTGLRGNVGAQVGLNFLPVFGLDGLLGIGGSMILSEDDFESVTHAHVLLASPQKGVFEMVSLKPTNYSPETWMPADTTAYMTTSWDINQMVTELTKLIENFQSEGAVDEWIEENINQELELDLKDDVLAHLTGRVTYVQWISDSMTISSQVQGFGIELSNPEAFEVSLDAIVARINRGNDDDDEDEDEENEPVLQEVEYKGVRMWTIASQQLSQQAERQRERRLERGEVEFETEELLPQPAFALIGNYFVVSGSPKTRQFLEHAIDTEQGDFTSLAMDEKFKQVNDKLVRQLKTDMPCAVMYSNPERSMRMMLEIASSEQANSLMGRGAEGNKYLAGIKARMDENPIPEFETLQKYFQPAGGFATTDETGYHFMAFGLRRDAEEDE